MGTSGSVYDDSVQFDLTEAVILAVVRVCDDVCDDGAVWDEFLASRDEADRAYFEALRSSRKPVHLYQQQRLYEFGVAKCSPDEPRQFCMECGRQFMRMFSFSAITNFLKAALASRGSFQTKIMEMLQQQLEKHAGTTFTLQYRVSAREISLTFESRRPDDQRAYFEEHGLDSDECFMRSFYFLAGALDQTFKHVVANYDPTMEIFSVKSLWGRMVFPVREDGLFTHQMLGQKLMGYLGGLVGVSGKKEKAPEAKKPTDVDLVVRSKAMKSVWEKIKRISRSDETVLLRGESGTGKSFIASRIHELSERRAEPFVEVGLTSDIGSDNMIQSDLFGHEKGAFTGATEQKRGLFALADGGTIFLDEIGDSTPELQAKLLRVIESSTFKRLGSTQDTKVDVRIVAATNCDLEKMVADGTFRQDLYYRLNVIPIELPPLRERPEDIPELVDFLLSRARKASAAQKRLEPGLASGLAAYSWPGNIRELDHALKYANAMSEGANISSGDFPDSVKAFLSGETPAPPSEGAAEPSGGIINLKALREMIRTSDPVAVGSSDSPHGIPAHIEHAKRAYLLALIDEFGGDLGLVAKFWDRSSEKTLRKLVREYGLAGDLNAARKRGPRAASAEQ